MTRVLTVENTTEHELGFVLCRKRIDGCLHLHIVDSQTEELHGVSVRSFDPPDMRTFMEGGVTEVDH